jgi:hypothetical protein
VSAQARGFYLRMLVAPVWVHRNPRTIGERVVASFEIARELALSQLVFGSVSSLAFTRQCHAILTGEF